MPFYGNRDLQGELNRLRNGGTTYPPDHIGHVGAANQWAGTSGFALVGALNVKAGNSGVTMADLDAVCNQLAGTSGWDATAALQQIPAGNMMSVDQASFETSTAGWSAGANTTVARTTAQAADGVASLSLTAVGIGVTSATSPNITGIVAGQRYTFTLSNRANTTGRATRLSAVWKTAAGATISTVVAATGTDVNTGWTNSVSTTLTAPATATQVALLAEINDATQVATEVHYIDKAGVMFGSRTAWVSP